MALEVKAVQDALAGLRQGMVADGYDLLVESAASGVARVRIVAGPEACEECLVPKSIMVGMMQASLEGLPVTSVEVVYPGE